MPLGTCVNNHVYNADKYGDQCPICKAVTKKSKEDGKTIEEIAAMLQLPPENFVCGWLVCIEGINKGRSYLIHPGKNFVGSGDDMDIQILGDDKVEPHRHAVLAFDDTQLKTTLLPGESRGLVYLENEAVYTPRELAEFVQIEIGAARFKYVPFCGENHNWAKQSSS